ncbi:hypothetical protein HDV02_002301 [Globomyces sp. JEL0801]|nr:hypothetical protein HDV02_002301 [Globomyces sp. JEL0801]
MPPKKDMLNAEEVLQAVVVADSFNEHFRPLSYSTPRCLIPLANIPLIEYTLESLAISQVEEIFIVCCALSDQIKQYIENSRWAKSTFPTITVIVSQELRSMGDVLRDLDAKQILQSDFILMSAHTVSNIDLTAVLESHRQRKLADKDCIMTLMLKQASSSHPTRSKAEGELFVLDGTNSELTHYETHHRYPHRKKFSLDPHMFKNHSDVIIRNDLIDCHIDICSIEVPALFTENFDYQDLRNDFLKGILESDLLGKTIYCHVIEDGYAAQVSTQQMYGTISSLILKDHVLIGSNTVVKKGSSISGSVIGENCVIGANVHIKNSYLLNNVIVGDNCDINQSIIGENVELYENVTLEKGCVIDFNAKLGPNVVVPTRTKVSFNHPDFDDEEHESDKSVLGNKSTGYVYEPDFSDDDDAFDMRNFNRGLLDYASSIDGTDHDYETGPDSDEDSVNENVVNEDSWIAEVEQTIERAFKDNHSVDIAVLELNTLKMAMNITFENLRHVVFPKIFGILPPNCSYKDLEKVLIRWCPILVRLTHSDADQIDCLNTMVQYLLNETSLINLTPMIIKNLYSIDLLEEGPILTWHESLDDAVGTLKKIRDAAQPFIDFLMEAESESDSDSD